jgi:signal transduction histidine kinase
MARRSVRSVRWRVTLAATLVTAVAVLLGGWFIVRTVDRTLLERAESARERVVAEVVRRIEAGADPTEVSLPPPSTPMYIQVQDLDGDVLVAGSNVPFTIPVERDTFTAAGQEVAISSAVADGPTGRVNVVAAYPLSEVERSVETLRNSLWIGLPLLVGLVAAVAWVATGRALRPVDAIRAEVDAITGSTLHRRVPEPATDDEVARLARTMNAMLDRLEAASDRQRQFVADASHELRTPVSTLRAELEVALQYPERADWPATARSLLAEEERLETLIADLLLLAQLDETDPVGSGATVDVGAIAREEAARANRSGVTVDVACDHDASLTVTGSPGLLARAISNLVSNAVRHARTCVEVSTARRDGRVRVIVDDDGAGIPAGARAEVFERFTRLEEGRARDHGGAGLGLPIARRIVERHSGSLQLEDAPLGGARLVIDLPAADRAAR